MAPGTRLPRRLSQPLPIIVEDGSDPPRIPPKSPRRPPLSTRTSYISTTSDRAAGAAAAAGQVNPGGGTFPVRAVRGHWHGIFKDQEAWVAKRGGWYRLVLAAILLVGLTVGLAAGLTIGLRNRNQAAPPQHLPTDLFPAGSYTFTTALTNVSTNCTRGNPSAWRCYPYSTYDPSAPSLAAAAFSWVITPATLYSYVISSSDNPFAPSFANVSLTLLDGNQYTERFTFRFPMAKAVVPATATATGPGPGPAVCWFNSTVVSATIWTRMRASYPASITGVPSPTNASYTFAPWPFAVEVKQSQEAGEDVPDCRDASGRAVDSGGGGGGGGGGTGSGECACWYSNYGLPPPGRSGSGGNKTARWGG
ncbi:hypothetical protein B0T22DRAFT_438302 [Podospora appendiculata]|uniref:Tat pathway signal sequence n=1 Tax=Podospora appendiculata TaxID=314037 RepID=A0AAE1CHX4_9PEZI|nr:hypothetical protein B0T22DRAFT_438302 [Podospora appendiculata]